MTDEKQPERRTASEIQALNDQVANETLKKLKAQSEHYFPNGYSPDFSFTMSGEDTPEAKAFFDYVENGDNPMTLGIEDRIAEAYREFEEWLE